MKQYLVKYYHGNMDGWGYNATVFTASDDVMARVLLSRIQKILGVGEKIVGLFNLTTDEEVKNIGV